MTPRYKTMLLTAAICAISAYPSNSLSQSKTSALAEATATAATPAAVSHSFPETPQGCLQAYNAQQFTHARAVCAAAGLGSPGNGTSLTILGHMAMAGSGITAPDYREAYMWYEQAAEKDSLAAMYQLGVLNSTGNGVDAQDTRQGFEWYWKAAHRGYGPAMYAIGQALFFGSGTEENKPKGYAWMLVASEFKYAPANTKKVEYASKLELPQVIEGQKQMDDILNSMRHKKGVELTAAQKRMMLERELNQKAADIQVDTRNKSVTIRGVDFKGSPMPDWKKSQREAIERTLSNAAKERAKHGYVH